MLRNLTLFEIAAVFGMNHNIIKIKGKRIQTFSTLGLMLELQSLDRN